MRNEEEIRQNNMRFYERLRQVPPHAIKTIAAGRLKGMSDINPVWRIKIMTEAFGPCGIGWKYEIVKQWHDVFGQEVKAFTNVNLYIKVDDQWSAPIPGTGGATIVEINSKGYTYVNDEGFKMALTDAMGVCMKSLGVAADIYFSKDKVQFDTKYDQQVYATTQQQAGNNTCAGLLAKSQDVFQEISNAKTSGDLKAIWDKYPQMQKDSRFTAALTARKDQLLKNGKS